MKYLAIYTVFLPLFSSIIVGLNTKNFSVKLAQFITIAATSISAIFSSILFYHIVISQNIIHIKLLKWIDISSFQADWSIYVDSLGVIMLLVVNFVSSLVHIYSVGYMYCDIHKQRFFAYLSLFTFFMLTLVTSDNLLQLFVGWEGVGLSSFLLIGFWFKKKSASNAALKAFLVNRVADIGLALSILLIAVTFKSIEYHKIFSYLNVLEKTYMPILFNISLSVIDIICILMFIGCMGKSAQLCLHTWLPDAMEGPTPVSALIHAATMVTAGVFLVARCSFLFEHSKIGLDMVTIIGALTCLFAASIALVQNDIKKIIAYSTCSQLGYMFFACGVSAYSVAVFHLVTHAFFKALLFLGAGSVIHAINDEQDIRKMGGLYRSLPITYSLMWIGSLALAGIFPLSGYFSKDLILEHAYFAGTKFGKFAYFMGIIAASFTSFYSFRLIILVFHKSSKLNNNILKNIHEAPKSMMIPMLLLAFGSIFSGYIGEHLFNISSSSSTFWNGALAIPHYTKNNLMIPEHFIKTLPLIVSISGIIIAFLIYLTSEKISKFFTNNFKCIYKLLLNKYYFDEIYNKIFVVNIRVLSNFLWKVFDNGIIDGVTNSIASVTFFASKMLRYLQTGVIYHYLLIMFISIIMIIYLVIFN